MSNEVYGFAGFADPISSTEEIKDELQQSTGLGIVLIEPDELYNFPAEIHPGKNSVIFMVTDRPDSNSASYLVDFENYAPGARIGLPTNGIVRLGLLLATIESLFADHGAERVCIAITDSSEIEEYKVTSRESFREEILNDFAELAPPCCLYDIKK